MATRHENITFRPANLHKIKDIYAATSSNPDAFERNMENLVEAYQCLKSAINEIIHFRLGQSTSEEPP